MKGLQFTFNNKNFEIYNTTENMIHAVELNKEGEKRSPNSKTLINFTIRQVGLGVRIGSIKFI